MIKIIIKQKSLDKVLKNAKKKRIKFLDNNLDNIVFLDYDGVINIDSDNYGGKFTNRDLIENLNKFCMNNNFKIVVISSWRKYSDYKEMLYNSGLDKRIIILGRTDISGCDRETEVIKYLEDNPYIGKFIVIDDGRFNQLSKYQVKTEYKSGFNKEKYEEALRMIER